MASVVLAGEYFRFVPSGSDSAWYTYPAYAVAEGADPSENIPDYTAPGPAPERPVAKFRWENRSNLSVPLTATWFRAFGPSLRSVRAFGAVLWIAVSLLVALAVWHLTGNGTLTLAAGALTVADSGVIAEGLANSRPDLPVLFIALLLLNALLWAFRTGAVAAWVTSIVLGCALALMHVTAANAIAFALALLLCMALIGRRTPGVVPIKPALFVATGVALVGTFLLRQPIMDALLPTAVPHALEAAGQHSLVDKLRSIVSAGVGAKVSMEVKRWTHYYFIANTAQFLFIVCGLGSAIMLARRGMLARTAATSLAVFGSFLAGALAMAAVDPHPQEAHALVLGVLGLVGAAACMSAALGATRIGSRTVGAVCVALVVCAFVLKLGHSYSVYKAFPGQGVSNAAIEAMLDTSIPSDRPIKIVGPTELWPLLVDRRQSILIMDRDRATLPADPVGPDFESAEFLAINQDYLGYGWGERAAQWSRDGRIVKLGEVGKCGQTRVCVALYRIVTNTAGSH